MPTTTDIKKLTINILTEDQYDQAVQDGVITDDQLSLLTDYIDWVQVKVMPPANWKQYGKLYQYIGPTTADFIHGYFYECIKTGDDWGAELHITAGCETLNFTFDATTFITYFSAIQDPLLPSQSWQYDGYDWIGTFTGHDTPADLATYGITYTGTPRNMDQFRVDVAENATYAWSQVNTQNGQVQVDWAESNSGSIRYILNKPTAVSAFTNDSGYQTSSDVSTAISTHNIDTTAHADIRKLLSNFRGTWANWTAVPTQATDYPEDSSGSKTPTTNDFMVVEDVSDYTASPAIEGKWLFIYSGDWSTAGKNGWAPEYSLGSPIPSASPSVEGIAKLYNTTGSNTDGSMTQASITTALDGKISKYSTLPNAQDHLGEIVEYTGTTTASLINGYFYQATAGTGYDSSNSAIITGAGITSLTVDVDVFAESGETLNTDHIIHYSASGSEWLNSGNVPVDLTTWGVTITGTPADNDELKIRVDTTTIYVWTQKNVQPNGDGTFVPAVSTANQVYGTDGSGNQTTYSKDDFLSTIREWTDVA